MLRNCSEAGHGGNARAPSSALYAPKPFLSVYDGGLSPQSHDGIHSRQSPNMMAGVAADRGVGIGAVEVVNDSKMLGTHARRIAELKKNALSNTELTDESANAKRAKTCRKKQQQKSYESFAWISVKRSGRLGKLPG